MRAYWLVPIAATICLTSVEGSPKGLKSRKFPVANNSTAGVAGTKRSLELKARQFVITCVDQHFYCPAWAKSGECHTNPIYMLVSCNKSCNQCGSGHTDLAKEIEVLKHNDLVLLAEINKLFQLIKAGPQQKPADYLPVGPQLDVPESTVTKGGWTRCHSQSLHERVQMSDIQAKCSKGKIMLSCRVVGTPNFAVLAWADSTSVFSVTDPAGCGMRSIPALAAILVTPPACIGKKVQGSKWYRTPASQLIVSKTPTHPSINKPGAWGFAESSGVTDSKTFGARGVGKIWLTNTCDMGDGRTPTPTIGLLKTRIGFVFSSVGRGATKGCRCGAILNPPNPNLPRPSLEWVIYHRD